MTTPRVLKNANPSTERARQQGDWWCAVHDHYLSQPIPNLGGAFVAVPCAAAPLIELDDRSPLDLSSLNTYRLSDGSIPRPVEPRDNRQVLHGIRALLAFIAFTLAAILMLLLAQATGTVHGGISTVEAPVTLQLLQPGPDPAVDYYAHAVFADGTERDLQLGGYVLHNGLVRIELGVTAEMGSTSGCRIVIDGVRVTQETAIDGGSTVCRWSAP